MASAFNAKFFNPATAPGATPGPDGTVTLRLDPDTAYVYGEAVVLAINVALATQRPLLLAGSPGSGKTTLAANVARVLNWKFYPRVVTSRTRAQDLMWSFDAMRRLADAQASVHDAASLRPREAYVEPQVLWWAFDAQSATRRGAAPGTDKVPMAEDPQRHVASANAVVLLDEIDKAEPDVPNDLLEALDTERFTVDVLDARPEVRGRRDRVLMFITTNGERELPAAFMRRCVVLKLESPSADWLVRIADDRFGPRKNALHRAVAERLMELRKSAADQNLREPSTAEYLDAVQACDQLQIDTRSPRWSLLEQSLLWKREQPLPVAKP